MTKITSDLLSIGFAIFLEKFRISHSFILYSTGARWESYEQYKKTFNANKLKTNFFFQIQLLELQRDVNFSFFTRALQEAERTLHNITQILTVK